jgi:magnesium-transporting ATPase (P-type)
MKEEVPVTLGLAKNAGVKIRALTGDSRETITGLGL